MKDFKKLSVLLILFITATSLFAQAKVYMSVNAANGYLVPSDPGAPGVGINESDPQHSLHILEVEHESTALFLDLKQTQAPVGQGVGGFFRPDYALRVNYQPYSLQSTTVFSVSESGQTRVNWQNTAATENLVIGQDMAVYRNSGNYVKMGFDGGTTPTLFWRNGSNEPLQFKSEVTGNSPLYLSEDGKVGINTTNFVGNHSLYIEGTTIAEEIYVKSVQYWPDYVFKDTYCLRPLEELEDFIEQEGHLPGMQKASVIEEEGLPLGETERVLTEKVEELTLYILQLKAEIDELKKQQASE